MTMSRTRPAGDTARNAFLLLLAVLLGPLSLCMVVADTYPQCVELDESVVASPIPYGFTAQEWKDQLTDVYSDDLSNMPVICTPNPNAGEYIIADPNDQQDVLYVGYTQRDWSRWDGWDMTLDLLVTPTTFGSAVSSTSSSASVWGIGNGATDVKAKITSFSSASYSTSSQGLKWVGQTITPAQYMKGVTVQLAQTYYGRGYSWFRTYAKSSTIDWIKDFKTSGRWDITGAFINSSFAINENYNIFRTAKKLAIRKELVAAGVTSGLDAAIDAKFDALTIDWTKDMPKNQDTFTWYEQFLTTVMTKQCLTRNTMVARRPGDSVKADAFGLFEGFDGTGYNLSLMMFYSGEWAYMCSRFLKFLKTSIIRTLRTSIYAQVAAMYVSYLWRINTEDRLNNQWTLRIWGWTSSTYFLIRSEAILRARGDWVSSDGVTKTDWSSGRATNADLIAMTEQEATKWAARFSQFGVTESLSTYYVRKHSTTSDRSYRELSCVTASDPLWCVVFVSCSFACLRVVRASCLRCLVLLC